MKVYISGPITGTNDSKERFEAAEKELQAAGFIALNPHKLNDILPEDTAYRQFLDIDLEMQKMCDAVYMLKGWQESKGCAIEFEWAYAHGQMIIFQEGRNLSEIKAYKSM